MTRFSRFYLLLVSFFCGAMIMAIELLGSRVLAPVFGSSIYVWGSLLGIIMAALSMGYIIAGKVADKRPDSTLLFSVIFISGALTFIIPYVSMPIMKLALFWGIIGGAILSTTLIFSLPIMLLAFVSPFIIKLLAKIQTVGDTAGKIYGFSTIGSIAGTFLTAFYMIPEVGTKASLLFSSIILLLLGAIGLILNRRVLRTKHISIIVCCAILMACSTQIAETAPDPNLVFTTESAYSHIEVLDQEERYAVRINTKNNYQSILYKDTLITNRYWDHLNIGPVLNNAKTALFLGVGGGTGLRQYYEFFDMNRIVGVEIDPDMIQIAKDYFGVVENDVVTLVAEDGIVYLRRHPGEKFDVIIVDAYGDTYIPFHMVTQEFFQEVKNHLSDNGIMIVNALSINHRTDLLNPLAKTIQTLYPSLFVLPLSDNHVLYASLNPLTLTDLQRRIIEYMNRNTDLPFSAVLNKVQQDIVTFSGNDDEVYTDDFSDAEKRIFTVCYAPNITFEKLLRRLISLLHQTSPIQ